MQMISWTNMTYTNRLT
uniref:Uncharacterized protein n=1 Tax=Rhizophora mucronata TaxID=61149 RepID=A0A2P2MYD3_RHIMU